MCNRLSSTLKKKTFLVTIRGTLFSERKTDRYDVVLGSEGGSTRFCFMLSTVRNECVFWGSSP